MEALTILEFRERYGTASEWRRDLCARFEEWLGIARSITPIVRVWVYGSFVSPKLVPGDVDVLVLTSTDFEIERLPAPAQPYFRQEILRVAWGLDIFLMPVGKSDPYIEDVKSLLTRDRAGADVMVEVTI